MFDMLTTQMLTAAIFGLSTFISSYLIYNVDKRIGEDNLQHLALFTDYGRIALQAMEEENPSSKHKQPFQTLEFLIRDFQDYDDEDDVDACVESMGPYLERILESSNRDTSEVRDQINICFEKLGVFGLTHPGKQVPNQNPTTNPLLTLSLLIRPVWPSTYDELVSLSQKKKQQIPAPPPLS